MDHFMEEVVVKHNRGVENALYFLSNILMVISALWAVMCLQMLFMQFSVILLVETLLSAGVAVLLFLRRDRLRTEYEYTFTNGDLDVSKVLGNSRRKYLTSLPMKNVDVLTPEYIPGIVVKDRAETLTGDIRVIKVEIDVSEAGDGSQLQEVPCDVRTDVTTHNWINGKIQVVSPTNPAQVISSTIIGNVDFVAGTVTVFCDNDRIKSIWMGGTTANRFNERSLDVVRRVEQIQHVMPESGPRFNTAITIEEAADALALQKIDMIADNVEYMGRSLAEFEDFEIRTFLWNSYDVQKAAQAQGVKIHNYDSLVEEGTFNLLPYDTYTHNISDWTKDSREYFERLLGKLKQKLKSPDIVIVAVCNPELVRFLQNGIEWVFTDDTQIAGIKIDYNFGVLTSSQDRVHIVTTHYMDPNEGIRFIVIPLTKELITYKHYKYNMVIDRGYRHAIHDLVPNVMATHRTLTFEVLPVQGKLNITGYDLSSPETLKR